MRLSTNAIGWLVIIFCAVTALFFAGAAHADPPSLTDRIALLVPRFGSRKVELVDAAEFATAVDTACKHERECAAQLVAMAIMESGLSLAVSRSEYSPHQGDSYIDKDGVRQHRAAGLWQLHKSLHNADTWGSDDLLTQARDARRMQLGGLAECRSFRGLDPVVGMWRVLSGGGCLRKFSGEDARMVLLARVRRAL